MNTLFVALSHRSIIQNAIQTLMYAVAAPIPGQTIRRTCVFFRPRQSSDKTYFKVVYGNGCSATVSSGSKNCTKVIT